MLVGSSCGIHWDPSHLILKLKYWNSPCFTRGCVSNVWVWLCLPVSHSDSIRMKILSYFKYLLSARSPQIHSLNTRVKARNFFRKKFQVSMAHWGKICGTSRCLLRGIFFKACFWQSPGGCVCGMFNGVHSFHLFKVLASQQHQKKNQSQLLYSVEKGRCQRHFPMFLFCK